MATKRINQPRETMFSGPRGGMVYQTAVDVSYAKAPKDKEFGIQGNPAVRFIPVDRKMRTWTDKSIDMPVECLDELITTLENIREEALRDGHKVG